MNYPAPDTILVEAYFPDGSNHRFEVPRGQFRVRFDAPEGMSKQDVLDIEDKLSRIAQTEILLRQITFRFP